MIEPGISLSTEDLQALARLHRESLSGSLLELAGRGGLWRYYRFVACSPRELLLLERKQGAIAAACVLSLDPDTLASRFLRSSLLGAGARILWEALTERESRRRLRCYLKDAHSRPEGVKGLPEVVQIFTSPAFQRQGAGTALLERAGAFLRGRALKAFCVKTLSVVDSPAIGFYRDLGFAEAGRGVSGGADFLFFIKTLRGS